VTHVKKGELMALGLLRRRRSRGASGAGPSISVPLPPDAGAFGLEVVDPMGQPMGGAEVTVTALDSHQVATHGITDPHGYFIATLPPGSYSMMTVAEGLPSRRVLDHARPWRAHSPRSGHVRWSGVSTATR
jgi:hypothetical protein